MANSMAVIPDNEIIVEGGGLVPSTQGASSGDVLTVGQNGPEWAAPGGGGGDDVVIVTTTNTYTEVDTAVADAMASNKKVYCEVDRTLFNTTYKMYWPLTYVLDDNSYYGKKQYIFLGLVQSGGTPSRPLIGIQTFSYTFVGTSTSDMMPAANTGYNDHFLKVVNGQPTWSTINQVPAYTSDDAGKVLQVQNDGTLAWVLPT